MTRPEFVYSFYVNYLATNSRIILILVKIAVYFISALVAFFIETNSRMTGQLAHQHFSTSSTHYHINTLSN